MYILMYICDYKAIIRSASQFSYLLNYFGLLLFMVNKHRTMVSGAIRNNLSWFNEKEQCKTINIY